MSLHARQLPDTPQHQPAELDHALATERRHLAISRAALARMRERAEALFVTGDKVAGDAYTAEQLGRHLARRVAELADDPRTPLFFGRLDFGDADADHAGRRYHVGRRHVTDEQGEPLVLDWRAPVSRAFYRASARDPQGLAVRRRFGFSDGTLTSFEDEHLDRGEELGTTSRILTAEIERPRVGPMRDIVATIQPEQDELVRADLADSICVQGAPGTGKTAVGLHRAAYLLYSHRERLRRSKVLVVGPNRAFLAYIAAVLPALGEVEVAQATVEDLVDRVVVRAVDPPAVAAIKHDARMAEVLRRAVDAYIGEPTEAIVVSDGSFRWRVGLEPLHRLVQQTREEQLPYAVGRERVRARLVGLLQRQAEARRAESPSDAWLRRMGRVEAGHRLPGRRLAGAHPGGRAAQSVRRRRPARHGRRRPALPTGTGPAHRRGRRGHVRHEHGRRSRRPGGRRHERGRRSRQRDEVGADAEGDPVDRRRRRPDRRGGRPARTSHRLRARRGGRGAGSVPDAVPGDRPTQRARITHPAR